MSDTGASSPEPPPTGRQLAAALVVDGVAGNDPPTVGVVAGCVLLVAAMSPVGRGGGLEPATPAPLDG